MTGTPLLTARRRSRARRSAIGSASAISVSAPGNFRSLMTSMSTSAVPAAGIERCPFATCAPPTSIVHTKRPQDGRGKPLPPCGPCSRSAARLLARCEQPQAQDRERRQVVAGLGGRDADELRLDRIKRDVRAGALSGAFGDSRPVAAVERDLDAVAARVAD